ncbi:hypothetical protein ACFPRL_27420 [Pseudoclavibacter helvolus]
MLDLRLGEFLVRQQNLSAVLRQHVIFDLRDGELHAVALPL